MLSEVHARSLAQHGVAPNMSGRVSLTSGLVGSKSGLIQVGLVELGRLKLVESSPHRSNLNRG